MPCPRQPIALVCNTTAAREKRFQLSTICRHLHGIPIRNAHKPRKRADSRWDVGADRGRAVGQRGTRERNKNCCSSLSFLCVGAVVVVVVAPLMVVDEMNVCICAQLVCILSAQTSCYYFKGFEAIACARQAKGFFFGSFIRT